MCRYTCLVILNTLHILLQEVFELRLSDGIVIADKVLHYETGSEAIMNSSVVSADKDYLLATGMDDSTQIYTLKYKVVKKKEGGQGEFYRI